MSPTSIVTVYELTSGDETVIEGTFTVEKTYKLSRVEFYGMDIGLMVDVLKSGERAGNCTLVGDRNARPDELGVKFNVT